MDEWGGSTDLFLTMALLASWSSLCLTSSSSWDTSIESSISLLEASILFSRSSATESAAEAWSLMARRRLCSSISSSLSIFFSNSLDSCPVPVEEDLLSFVAMLLSETSVSASVPAPTQLVWPSEPEGPEWELPLAKVPI